MKPMKLNKRVIAALMAVLMIAAVSTVSAFAGDGGPGNNANPYFYVWVPSGPNAGWFAIPHGQDLVESAVVADDTVYVDFGIGTFPSEDEDQAVIGKVESAVVTIDNITYTYTEGVTPEFEFPANANDYIIIDELYILISTNGGDTWVPHSTYPLTNVKFVYAE